MALAQFELFTNEQDTARRFVVLNVENFDQNTFFQMLVRLNVGLVIDLRLRSVFDSPLYSHVDVLNYFTNRCIQFLQFPLIQKKIERREFSFLDYLDSRRSFSNSTKSIVAIVDSDERSRLNTRKLRMLFARIRVPIVETLASVAVRR
jgi:hypothetical protein